MSHSPDVSIVIPVLNERDNVDELCSRIRETLEPLEILFEVIFVDDQSTDGTIEKLEAIHASDKRFQAVQFSRRFGYQISIFAGLEHSRGDVVITMDSDLQHPPEVIPRMLAKFREGQDVVNMVRKNLGEKSLLKRAGGMAFYRLINFLSPTPMALQSADFRLYSRQVVDVIREFPERTLFLRGLVGWVGFRQANLEFEEGTRTTGETKFSFWAMVKFAADAIVSFSTSPLYAALYIGTALSVTGGIYGVYTIAQALFTDNYPAGWPTIVCLLLMIGGAQMLLLGIIGIYVAKMFVEVKSRPRYIVRTRIGIDHQDS